MIFHYCLFFHYSVIVQYSILVVVHRNTLDLKDRGDMMSMKNNSNSVTLSLCDYKHSQYWGFFPHPRAWPYFSNILNFNMCVKIPIQKWWTFESALTFYKYLNIDYYCYLWYLCSQIDLDPYPCHSFSLLRWKFNCYAEHEF